MMDIESIKAINKEKGEEASEMGIEPYIALHDGDEGVRSAPHIGDYRPSGWEETEIFFVDNSGMGAENESALTFRQFLTKVKKGFGYAIIEAGQFQVRIAEFKRL